MKQKVKENASQKTGICKEILPSIYFHTSTNSAWLRLTPIWNVLNKTSLKICSLAIGIEKAVCTESLPRQEINESAKSENPEASKGSPGLLWDGQWKGRLLAGALFFLPAKPTRKSVLGAQVILSCYQN